MSLPVKFFRLCYLIFAGAMYTYGDIGVIVTREGGNAVNYILSPTFLPCLKSTLIVREIRLVYK